MAAARRTPPTSLGRAVPDISRAWVFTNRVIAITKMRSIDPNLLLARVVAHEIGHLLLESRAHAAHGIMRAGLDVNGVGFYRFTENQAAEMRDAVRRHTVR